MLLTHPVAVCWLVGIHAATSYWTVSELHVLGPILLISEGDSPLASAVYWEQEDLSLIPTLGRSKQCSWCLGDSREGGRVHLGFDGSCEELMPPAPATRKWGASCASSPWSLGCNTQSRERGGVKTGAPQLLQTGPGRLSSAGAPCSCAACPPVPQPQLGN